MLQSIWKFTLFANSVVRLKTVRKVSPFTNGLRNMKTGRAPGYGNMKAGRLRGYEQEWRANRACGEQWDTFVGYGRAFFAGWPHLSHDTNRYWRVMTPNAI